MQPLLVRENCVTNECLRKTSAMRSAFQKLCFELSGAIVLGIVRDHSPGSDSSRQGTVSVHVCLSSSALPGNALVATPLPWIFGTSLYKCTSAFRSASWTPFLHAVFMTGNNGGRKMPILTLWKQPQFIIYSELALI